MKSAFLDDYQIHSSEENPNGIYLEPNIPGLISPTIRYAGIDRIGASGHLPFNQIYGARQLPWRGFIVADTITKFNQRRRELAQALAITNDAHGDPVPKRLTFTTDDDQEYWCDVLLNREPDMPDVYMMQAPFFLPMIAPQPQLYRAGLVTTSAITRPIGSGVEVPTEVPVVLGSITGGSMVVTNQGSMFTWPTITLSGKVTNPFLYNQKTGDVLQLNYESNSGDQIVIDTQRELITINNSSSLINTPVEPYDFLRLDPGANPISFSTSDSDDTGTMQMSFYHADIGA